MPRKVLIVEDDGNIAELLHLYLEKEGFETQVAPDGGKGVELFRAFRPDLVLLDIMLPVMDGWQVCREIRKKSQCPIIMLTAKGEVFDKVLGLELGADDYMTKPFSPRELMLRISAILKRGKSLDSLEPQSIERDGIYIDLTARRVHVDGTLVSLTPKEFDLLALLASHPDVVFSRKKLLDTVWGGELPEDTRTLDTHIKQVRHAISPYSDRIVTLRGVGYRFEKT